MFRKKIATVFFLIAIIMLVFACLTLWSSLDDLLNRSILLIPVFFLIWGNFRVSRYLARTKQFRYLYLVPLTALFSINVIFISYDVALSYSDYHLKQRAYPDTYPDINSCSKVWSTRGLVPLDSNNMPAVQLNSIESVQLAYDNGAAGIEVDVFYDPKMGQYVVSHDRNPYKLKNGKLLSLNELFIAAGNRGYFWLDFKKLRHLDSEQLDAAVARLEMISSPFDLKKRLYVEGAAPVNLKAFQRAGFQTIFDIQPTVDSNLVTPLVANAYKIVYYFGDYTVIGMNHGDKDAPIYGKRMREILGNIPVFIYHVPDDRELLKELSPESQILVLLPRDQSLNLFSITHCN